MGKAKSPARKGYVRFDLTINNYHSFGTFLRILNRISEYDTLELDWEINSAYEGADYSYSTSADIGISGWCKAVDKENLMRIEHTVPLELRSNASST